MLFICTVLMPTPSQPKCYRSAKQHSEPVSKPHNKRGAKVDEITRTPLELIERIAALAGSLISSPFRPSKATGAVVLTARSTPYLPARQTLGGVHAGRALDQGCK